MTFTSITTTDVGQRCPSPFLSVCRSVLKDAFPLHHQTTIKPLVTPVAGPSRYGYKGDAAGEKDNQRYYPPPCSRIPPCTSPSSLFSKEWHQNGNAEIGTAGFGTAEFCINAPSTTSRPRSSSSSSTSPQTPNGISRLTTFHGVPFSCANHGTTSPYPLHLCGHRRSLLTERKAWYERVFLSS